LADPSDEVAELTLSALLARNDAVIRALGNARSDEEWRAIWEREALPLRKEIARRKAIGLAP